MSSATMKLIKFTFWQIQFSDGVLGIINLGPFHLCRKITNEYFNFDLVIGKGLLSSTFCFENMIKELAFCFNQRKYGGHVSHSSCGK